ncbi:MAG: ABC transporter permease [Gemmatimonadota bacterium]|nr:ABC transporter permease [Gemmatimonadota bacterium]
MSHFTVPNYPDSLERATQTFPIPQRAGILVFRQVTRTFRSVFGGLGDRVYFLRDVVRAFAEPGTYLPLTMGQMRRIGVDSLPLIGTVMLFLGAVSAYQTSYQLFPGAQKSAVSWILRQSIMLELGPLLAALVLAGRVGARMTAEIGTMRVTEQIDALETLSYDPLAYLVVPRLLAAVAMVPILTMVGNTLAIVAGYFTAVLAAGIPSQDFTGGLHLSFAIFQVIYGLIKATLFGGAIALVSSYEGYVTGAGAEGVGASTARAVVISSVVILMLDALTAFYLAAELQP